MKKEIRLLIEKSLGQRWTWPNGQKASTYIHEASNKELDALSSYDYHLYGVLAIRIEWIKTFFHNMNGFPHTIEIIVREDASYVEVLNAIAMAEKSDWYRKYCTGQTLYQIGYSWYTKEEILRDNPDFAWMVTK